MNTLTSAWKWCSGGEHQYMSTNHCMHDDMFWSVFTQITSLLVFSGYLMIAFQWWKAQQKAEGSPSALPLRRLRDIFILCATCGYAFNIIRFYWPAWRLFDLVQCILITVTFAYAWAAGGLNVIFEEISTGLRRKASLERAERVLKEMELDQQRKNQFLNAVSHDLRTPMNAIALEAYAARMAFERGDQQSGVDSLQALQRTTEAAVVLLNRLLDIRKFEHMEEPNERDMFAITALFNDVIDELHAKAVLKNLTVDVNGVSGQMLVTDRMKVKRILIDLLDNSIKYTMNGGVSLAANQNEDFISIKVIDTGIGIPENDMGLLFGEFYQGHNNGRNQEKGFGLGLHASRLLARQLGGDLKLESTGNAGTTFCLTLPNQMTEISTYAAQKETVTIGGG